jgi:hypothetical protein
MRVNCPAKLTSGAYLLTFTAAGKRLPTVTIQASGCRLVTGLSPIRRASSASFWKLLSTISGSPPGGPIHLPGCATPATRALPRCNFGTSPKPKS